MSRKRLWLTFGLFLVLFLVFAAWCLSQHARSATNSSTAVMPKADPRTDLDNAPDAFWKDVEIGERTIDGLPVRDMSNTTMHAPFNWSNPDLMVAYCDYALVGRIEKHMGTRHPDESSFPWTDYDVTILKVIKGNLEVGQEVTITKEGGVSKSGSYVKLIDKGDFMPKVGGVYIFLARVLPDPERTLSVFSSYSTVPLESNIAAELRRVKKSAVPNKQESISMCLKDSKVFARYVTAAKNKDADAGLPRSLRNDGLRYKSVYEK